MFVSYVCVSDLLLLLQDRGATAARIATAASVACSFPFVFLGMREGLLPSLRPLLISLVPM